jgi:hypothetical protein
MQTIFGTGKVARSGFNIDTSAWSASKAMANGAASDNPGKYYAGICAGRKEGNPHNQASWALPYRYTPSSAPNAAAVKNALARINQTDGLTNKSEAQSLLEGLMKKIQAAAATSGKSVAAAQADFAIEYGTMVKPRKRHSAKDLESYLDTGFVR